MNGSSAVRGAITGAIAAVVVVAIVGLIGIIARQLGWQTDPTARFDRFALGYFAAGVIAGAIAGSIAPHLRRDPGIGLLGIAIAFFGTVTYMVTERGWDWLAASWYLPLIPAAAGGVGALWMKESLRRAATRPLMSATLESGLRVAAFLLGVYTAIVCASLSLRTIFAFGSAFRNGVEASGGWRFLLMSLTAAIALGTGSILLMRLSAIARKPTTR
jgi:hypothetical protein